MIFPFNIYALALVAGAIVSAVSLPLWRGLCRRVKLVDDPGHRKIHHTPIPLAGGLAVFTGILVPILIGVLLPTELFGKSTAGAALEYGVGARKLQLAAIVGGAFGMLLIGILDDRWELKPALKFGGQLLVALLVAAAGVRITLFIPSVAFSYFITVFWILTIVNAFNFMDNMNGLCGGLGAIASFQFATIAAVNGQYLVATFALLVAGALVGFLFYNFPKASVFLGDSGSHLVGYLLAILGILPHFYSAEKRQVAAVFSPLLILAMPLLDLLSVVIIRWRMGKPFYIGDTNHLSHRLVRQGLSPARTVLIIWLMAAVIGTIAMFI